MVSFEKMNSGNVRLLSSIILYSIALVFRFSVILEFSSFSKFVFSIIGLNASRCVSKMNDGSKIWNSGCTSFEFCLSDPSTNFIQSFSFRSNLCSWERFFQTCAKLCSPVTDFVWKNKNFASLINGRFSWIFLANSSSAENWLSFLLKVISFSQIPFSAAWKITSGIAAMLSEIRIPFFVNTKMSFVIEAFISRPCFTVSLTLYLPEFWYLCVMMDFGSCPAWGGVPSPKSHQSTGDPYVERDTSVVSVGSKLATSSIFIKLFEDSFGMICSAASCCVWCTSCFAVSIDVGSKVSCVA